MQCLKAFDDGPGPPGAPNLASNQVMNDGREALDRAVADRKCVRGISNVHHSPRWVNSTPNMSKGTIAGGRWLFHEAETSLGVDEAFDQPGAAHSIDAGPRPRYPDAALEGVAPGRLG